MATTTTMATTPTTMTPTTTTTTTTEVTMRAYHLHSALIAETRTLLLFAIIRCPRSRSPFTNN
eukprot:565402-Lingulodinium_polyedra.AAC.1